MTRPATLHRFLGALVVAGALLALPASAQAQDLYVKSFLVGVTGSTVTYQAIVCNAGSTTTKSFDLEIYYNLTSAPGCTSLQSQTYVFSTGLAYGACSTQTFTQYSASNGSYKAWARVDADCDVTETNESNNNASYNYVVGSSYPDLRVTNFTASVSGSTVTYSATVCNSGGSTSSGFDLEIYYDESSEPTCSTIQDATYRFSTGLAAGSCSTRTFTQTSVTAGTYTGWARVDADCEITESNELNNNDSAIYSVSAAKPDLYLAGFSVTVSGTSVTYTAKVCNGGASTTASFDLEYFWDRTTSPTCSSSADYQESFKGLSSGTCSTKTYTRTGVAYGTYTGWAMIDADCLVSESNEGNNVRYDNYQVGPTLPDLRISSFTVSVSGTTATYTATVCNDGASTSTAFNLEIYYSLTSAPGCSTGYSNYYRFTSGLAASTCSTRTFTQTGVSSGSHSPWARIDANCEVTESNENNNNDQTTFTVGYPDLYISSLTVASSGSTVTYTANVCNAGMSTTTSFTLGLFYNQTSTPTCSSTPNAKVTVAGLASGKCTLQTFTSTGVAYGSYTAWAMADSSCAVTESSETNNATSKSYIVGPTQPNLAVSTFAVTVSGTSVTYAVTVCNSGLSTTSDFDIEVYYHRVSAPSCSSAEDRTYKVSGGLAYGKCVTQSFLRTAAPTGNYTAWARADADCLITESDETDNNKSQPYTVGTAAQPEIYVSTFDVTVSGTTVTYEATVCNAGSAAGAFTLGIYYNQSAAPTCTQKPDWTYSVSGLSQGQCTKQSYVRTGATAGTFGAWAFGDSDCKLTETNENNNTSYKSYTVAATQPDLYVSNFTVTPTQTQTTFEVTVCNGGKAASAATQVGLFANRTSTPTCSDTADSTLNIGTLNPSSCDTQKVTTTALAAGPYVAWALADNKCAVTESDETNNTMAQTYVVPSPPADMGAPADAEIIPDGIKADKPKPDQEVNEEDAGKSVDGGFTEVEGGTVKPDQSTVNPTTPEEDDGCGCRLAVPAERSSVPAPLLLAGLFLGLALLLRRRR